jgi:hypothetical protein
MVIFSNVLLQETLRLTGEFVNWLQTIGTDYYCSGGIERHEGKLKNDHLKCQNQ